MDMIARYRTDLSGLSVNLLHGHGKKGNLTTSDGQKLEDWMDNLSHLALILTIHKTQSTKSLIIKRHTEYQDLPPATVLQCIRTMRRRWVSFL